MERIKLTVLAAATMLIMTSCSSMWPITKNDMMSIQPGMTKQEVVKQMGKPSLRSFENNHEILEFDASDINSIHYTTMIRIFFEDDRVVRMESIPLMRNTNTVVNQSK